MKTLLPQALAFVLLACLLTLVLVGTYTLSRAMLDIC